MKRYFIFILLAFVCTLLCTGPSTLSKFKNAAETPQIDKSPILPFQPLPSVINVPIEIKTDVVEKMLNQQLKDLLYQCDTLSIGSIKPVKVKVWKKDSISISLNGDELHYRVPLRIWMQFQFTINVLGLSHTEYQDVEAGIALKFKSRLYVKNNWKVVSLTQSEGYDWLSDPVVKVRILSVPVKPVADLILSRQQKAFGDMVDKAVGSMLDVKKMVQPLWHKMQSPILLSSSPDSIWLRLSPSGVYMTQLEGADGVIKSSIGIQSVAETYFGSQPYCKINDTLPEFVVPGKVDSTFVINLYNEITYESATQMARGLLVGKNFKSGKHEAIINDISLYGLDGYALVSIDLSGTYKGKVYVIGKVVYDSLNEEVKIDDLDFDLTTKNRLHKLANDLFHDVILEKIKPLLKFPLRDQLTESQNIAKKMITNKEIIKNVFVNGSVDSLSIGGITCSNRAIIATLLAKGVLTLHIHN